MDANDKKKFRAKKEWKEFRLVLMEERGCSCELCGTTYKGTRKRGIQAHHLFPDQYTNLDPSKFVLLCSSCHDLVERISRKILSGNTILRNKELWYQLLKDVLPDRAKESFEMYLKKKNDK